MLRPSALRSALNLCLATASIFAVAQVSPNSNPAPLHLLGGGRACTGDLRLTPVEFKWKTSFSTCRAPYKVLSHQNGEWLIEIAPAETSAKVCPYKIVEIRNTDPSYPHAQWQVASYKSPADRSATPKQPVYACTMQKP